MLQDTLTLWQAHTHTHVWQAHTLADTGGVHTHNRVE